MENETTQTKKLLRLPAVIDMTGFSKTQIYRLMRQGQFPARRKISPRITAWSSAAIADYIESKLADP